MALKDIHLKDYDTVVAVNQAAINNIMAVFLNQQDLDVKLYYNKDDQGNFVPAKDKEDADYAFEGTMGYKKDPQGNPEKMLELYTDAGNQTVCYNVTFKKAEYTVWTVVHHEAKKVTYKQDKDPWIFKFHVSLALQETVLKKLPEEIRKKVEKYLKKIDPNMFSIQQLLVDLNAAVFSKFENITGLPTGLQGDLATIIGLYVKEQQKKGNILFGVAATAKEEWKVPPTFMPTSLNFCITPYLDAKGKPSNPSLDTLNYLLMTEKRRPPAYPPKSFDFNWVESTDRNGVMAVKSELVIPYLVDKLNVILKPMCPTIKVNAEHNKIELGTGKDHDFTVSGSPTQKKIATFSYSAKDDDVYSTPIYQFWNVWNAAASASIDVSCTVSIKNSNLIHIAGTIVAETGYTRVQWYSSGKSSTISMKMPKTTYSWSVDLLPHMKIQSGSEGILELVIKNPDFNQDPKVEKKTQTWWEKFVSGASGCVKVYIDNLGNMRDQVENEIDTIYPTLKNYLESLNAFVFPGGKTFLFKDPMFSNALDLASTITYQM